MPDNKLTIKVEAPEIVNAMFVPVAKSIGTTISHAWEGFTIGVETWYGKKIIDSENNLKLYADEVNKQISQIPEDKLQEPQMNILGPALEASKFYFEEPQYREMFAKLIAASCDTRTNNKIHPFYVEAIKQITPLEAKLLATFKSSDMQPIVNYQLNLIEGGAKTLHEHILALPNGLVTLGANSKMYASAMINLQRLGFVTIEYEKWITDDSKYEPFKKSSIYLTEKEFMEKRPDAKSYEIQKGVVSLTPLGSNFLDICI